MHYCLADEHLVLCFFFFFFWRRGGRGADASECVCVCFFCPTRHTTQASSRVVEVWEATREALRFLAADEALSHALERRVSALEGVRSSDEDICQVGRIDSVVYSGGRVERRLSFCCRQNPRGTCC